MPVTRKRYIWKKVLRVIGMAIEIWIWFEIGRWFAIGFEFYQLTIAIAAVAAIEMAIWRFCADNPDSKEND